MNNKMTTPSQHENTEADFLSRLQSQFGDMDLTNLLHDENGKKTNQSENDSQESSLLEPTQAELESWQNAQFEKGQKVLQQKKCLDMPAVQRRRDAPFLCDEDDDWERVASLPRLCESSFFFPESDTFGNSILGIHPLLQRLSLADPEILGTNWKRLYSSAQGDGLSFHRLLSTISGYVGPTVMLISGTPSKTHTINSKNRDIDERRSSIGFYTTSGWSESPVYFGSEECFLFTMDHDENQVNFLKPKTTASAKNYMYCYPSSMNLSNRRSQTIASSSSTDGCVHGLGVGGTSKQPRLHLTENLEECRAMEFCSTFESGPLLKEGSDSLYFFDIDCLEVWGVGGDEWISKSLMAQKRSRYSSERAMKRAQTVDKKQIFDDLKSLGTSPGLFDHMEYASNRTDV